MLTSKPLWDTKKQQNHPNIPFSAEKLSNLCCKCVLQFLFSAFIESDNWYQFTNYLFTYQNHSELINFFKVEKFPKKWNVSNVLLVLIWSLVASGWLEIEKVWNVETVAAGRVTGKIQIQRCPVLSSIAFRNIVLFCLISLCSNSESEEKLQSKTHLCTMYIAH